MFLLDGMMRWHNLPRTMQTHVKMITLTMALEKICGLDMVLAEETIVLLEPFTVGAMRKTEGQLTMTVAMERVMVIFHKFFGKPLPRLDVLQQYVTHAVTPHKSSV